MSGPVASSALLSSFSTSFFAPAVSLTRSHSCPACQNNAPLSSQDQKTHAAGNVQKWHCTALQASCPASIALTAEATGVGLTPSHWSATAQAMRCRDTGEVGYLVGGAVGVILSRQALEGSAAGLVQGQGLVVGHCSRHDLALQPVHHKQRRNPADNEREACLECRSSLSWISMGATGVRGVFPASKTPGSQELWRCRGPYDWGRCSQKGDTPASPSRTGWRAERTLLGLTSEMWRRAQNGLCS